MMKGVSLEDQELHERLLEGDVLAPLEVLERLGPGVIQRLQRRYPWIEAEVVHDAAIDACLEYSEKPSRYDPNRLGLESYLVMSAAGDVLNLVRKLARMRPAQEIVEKRLRLAEHEDVIPDPAIALVDRLEAAAALERLREAFPDTQEAVVLELMMHGVRDNKLYAEVLGLSDRPLEEQRRAIKQTKDRITKRLARLRMDR